MPSWSKPPEDTTKQYFDSSVYNKCCASSSYKYVTFSIQFQQKVLAILALKLPLYLFLVCQNNINENETLYISNTFLDLKQKSLELS